MKRFFVMLFALFAFAVPAAAQTTAQVMYDACVPHEISRGLDAVEAGKRCFAAVSSIGSPTPVTPMPGSTGVALAVGIPTNAEIVFDGQARCVNNMAQIATSGEAAKECRETTKVAAKVITDVAKSASKAEQRSSSGYGFYNYSTFSTHRPLFGGGGGGNVRPYNSRPLLSSRGSGSARDNRTPSGGAVPSPGTAVYREPVQPPAATSTATYKPYGGG